MKTFIAALLTTVSLLTGTANAYCVYNDTDKPAHFSGVGINLFRATLDPKPNGKDSPQSCCNWQNNTCNPSGKRDAMIQMALSMNTEGGKHPDLRCGDVFKIDNSKPFAQDQGEGIGLRMQAGGYARARKQDGKYFLDVFDIDHKLRASSQCRKI